MKRFIMIIVAGLAMAGCGFVASGVSDFTDIKSVVTASEVQGHWVLRTNVYEKFRAEGFVLEQGQKFFITLGTNATYSCRVPTRRADGKVEVTEEEGKWTMIYDPKGRFVKNRVILRNSRNASIELNIGLDGERMVLWRHWGETGARVDIVFEEKSEVVREIDDN